MIKVTLDHNCIISLEKDAFGEASSKDTESAKYVKALIALHNPPKIIISAAAIGASEHLPQHLQQLLNGRYNHNFADYEQRIARLGLLHADIPLPKPVGRWGMTYWGHSVWGGPETKNLEQAIQRIMFPDIDFDYQPYYEEQIKDSKNTKTPEEIGKKWRNAKCDVLGMWSHINTGGSIFTTDDKNILRDTPEKPNKTNLIKLGAGDILNPKDTLERVQALASNISG